MIKEKSSESIFLNENMMAVACLSAVLTSIASFALLCLQSGSHLTIFEIMIKLVTTIAMFFAFRHYNWDVAKGLMGGVLFCFMYQEAYLVLGKLWSEQDFDVYLVVGVQGSLYLAAAGMSFLMTIIITIIFKFIIYIILIVTNSMLGFSALILWANALLYISDMSILFMLICIESQFDSFKLLHHELLKEKRERKNRE